MGRSLIDQVLGTATPDEGVRRLRQRNIQRTLEDLASPDLSASLRAELESDLRSQRAELEAIDLGIPIGTDVQDVFRIYLNWRARKQFQSVFLFVTREDRPISRRRMNTTFERLRTTANVLRHDGGIYQPRMHDLRYTFAVHRITSWIRNKADLNRMMLPALAAYMGQVGLGSTERYLLMTPERFRKELDKLSLTPGNGRWRDNKGLMKFLSNL